MQHHDDAQTWPAAAAALFYTPVQCNKEDLSTESKQMLLQARP